MNDHEKLIEDARAFADNGNGLNWQGRIRELADALEALEKAHAPTDDEREALARIIRDRRIWNGYDSDEQDADAILAAGFRRSEVPEPSAESGHELIRERDHHGIDAQPQGEPSDAQALAALHEFVGLYPERDNHFTESQVQRMRAALRAAAEAGGEGR